MGITICNGKHVEGYDANRNDNSAEAVAAHNAECHERTYEGAVLRLRERNGYDDSDFYALVWDEEQQATREIMYATTRGWTYHNGANIDATHEVIEKAVAHMTAVRFALVQRDHAETPRMGYTARAVEKGAAVEGVIAWVGKSRNRYADINRYGIRVEGRKGYVFRDATDDDFAFDVAPVSDEDMVTWRATCEHNVRGELAQAQAIADQRDPRPAAPAPGVVVDAQEADADGWRLYAVGESFCEDSWTQGVAVAVVDESAGGYVITGQRADGSAMPVREATVFKALGTVARWADGEGTLIMHDGAGAVRLVRDTGAWLELRPVRPQEAAGAPEEDGEQQEAAESAEGSQGVAQGFRHDPCAPTPGLDADGRRYAVGDRVEDVHLARTGPRRGKPMSTGVVTALLDGRPVVRFDAGDEGEVDVRPDLFRIVAQGAPQEAEEAEERHEMTTGEDGAPVCVCGLADVDALLGHWTATGVLPVVPVVEMSGVWRITGRGAEVYVEGASDREAWADAARRGFERDYFHAITHLSVEELEALTAPEEAAAEGERVV